MLSRAMSLTSGSGRLSAAACQPAIAWATSSNGSLSVIGAGLLAGVDEGVCLDLHAVVGELDLAVDGLPSVVAGVRAAGDGAAEPLGPLRQRVEGVRGVAELEVYLLACLRDADVLRCGQVAVFGQQVGGVLRERGDVPLLGGRDHGHVVGNADRGVGHDVGSPVLIAR